MNDEVRSEDVWRVVGVSRELGRPEFAEEDREPHEKAVAFETSRRESTALCCVARSMKPRI